MEKKNLTPIVTNKYFNPKLRSYSHDPPTLPLSRMKLPRLSNEDQAVISPTRVSSTIAHHQIYGKKPGKLQTLKTKGFGSEAICSRAGCYGSELKINQDAGFVHKFASGCILYAVADGHGANGHFVSSFIKRQLPSTINKMLSKQTQLNPGSLSRALRRGITHTNTLLLSSDINTDLSGSTLVCTLIYKQSLVVANVGDSRAILISHETDWEVLPLTVDQKPSRPDEQQRILKAGGRVDHQRDMNGDSVGPLRVWLKHIWMPGLAMTRCLGDKIGAKAGTIADPQIQIFQLRNKDKAILLASDGVWEFLDEGEVLKVIQSSLAHGSAQGMADRTVRSAIQAWRKRSISRDDITAVTGLLNPL